MTAPTQFRVNSNINRAYLPNNVTPPYEVSNPDRKKHGEYISGACDEYGRQYVVSSDHDGREFSERVIIGPAAPVDRAFIGRRLQLTSLYGFNVHTEVLFVQLWKTNPSYSLWPTVPGWADALGILITQFPIQPNYGTFSLDLPWVFRDGLSIAISTTITTWTSAGNKLAFTAFAKMREGDATNTD